MIDNPGPADLVKSLHQISEGGGLTSYADRRLPPDTPAPAIPTRSGAAVSNERRSA